jgi:hypothetical protein
MAPNTIAFTGELSDKEQCLITHHLPGNTVKATSISVCNCFVEGEWGERLAIYLGFLSTSEFIIYSYFPIEYKVVFD